MIDYSELIQVLEDGLDQSFNTVRVVYENTADKPVREEHISLHLSDVDSGLAEMGGQVYLVRGILTIRIMTELGIGSKKARGIGSELNTFINTFDRIKFNEPEFIAVGPLEDVPLFEHQFTASYEYMYGQDDSN